MRPYIPVRSATRAGGWLQRRVREITSKARSAGLPTTSQIMDGFILRGARLVGEKYVGYIIDTPGFVLLPGFTKVTDAMNIADVAVPVGARDDFMPSLNMGAYANAPKTVRYSTGSKSYLVLSTQPGIDDSANFFFSMNSNINRSGPILNFGKVFVETLGQTASAELRFATDNTSLFDFSTEIGAIGQMVVAPIMRTFVVDGQTTATISPTAQSYFQDVYHKVTESDLSDGWKLALRRLVPRSEYLPDPTARWWSFSRYKYTDYTPAFTTLPSESTDLVGVDKFCLVCRVFRQYPSTWPSQFGTPQLYDMAGEQGLYISIAAFNRETYDPELGPVEATVIDSFYIDSADLAVGGIAPSPATISTPLTPEVPNSGQFRMNHVVNTTEGFQVFSVYHCENRIDITIDQYAGDGLDALTRSPSPLPWSPYGEWQYAVISVRPDKAVEVLSYDRAVLVGITPVPSGANALVVALPVIVGADTVRVSTEMGVEMFGCAVVWESFYWRVGDIGTVDWSVPPFPVNHPYPEHADKSHLCGGRWVLYISDGGSATQRVELSGLGNAPLFAPLQWYAGVGTPFAQIGTYSSTYDTPIAETTSKYCSVCWMGGNKLVTASMPDQFSYIALVEGGKLVYDNGAIDEHDITCMVIDVATGTTEKRGVITQRSSMSYKCHISCVQMYHAAEGEQPEVDACLLASYGKNIEGNGGIDGKVYISLDSGWTWSEYIGDLSGPGGAFFIGNKLWRFDNTKPMTVGEQG